LSFSPSIISKKLMVGGIGLYHVDQTAGCKNVSVGESLNQRVGVTETLLQLRETPDQATTEESCVIVDCFTMRESWEYPANRYICRMTMNGW